MATVPVCFADPTGLRVANDRPHTHESDERQCVKCDDAHIPYVLQLSHKFFFAMELSELCRWRDLRVKRLLCNHLRSRVRRTSTSIFSQLLSATKLATRSRCHRRRSRQMSRASSGWPSAPVQRLDSEANSS